MHLMVLNLVVVVLLMLNHPKMIVIVYQSLQFTSPAQEKQWSIHLMKMVEEAANDGICANEFGILILEIQQA